MRKYFAPAKHRYNLHIVLFQTIIITDRFYVCCENHNSYEPTPKRVDHLRYIGVMPLC